MQALTSNRVLAQDPVWWFDVTKRPEALRVSQDRTTQTTMTRVRTLRERHSMKCHACNPEIKQTAYEEKKRSFLVYHLLMWMHANVKKKRTNPKSPLYNARQASASAQPDSVDGAHRSEANRKLMAESGWGDLRWARTSIILRS